MGICESKSRQSGTKKEEKVFNYEDKNIKIQKIYSRETTRKGVVISEKQERHIFIKNPNVNYLGNGNLYLPKLKENSDNSDKNSED